MAGKPAHVPTEASRAEVSALASFGVRQDEIANYMQVDAKTLRKHYRDELDKSRMTANVNIARRLYTAAMDQGSVPAMIFWLKAQAGWREKQELEVTGADGGPLEVVVTRRIVKPS